MTRGTPFFGPLPVEAPRPPKTYTNGQGGYDTFINAWLLHMGIFLDVTSWVFTAVAFFLGVVSLWKGYRKIAVASLIAVMVLSVVVFFSKRAERTKRANIEAKEKRDRSTAEDRMKAHFDTRFDLIQATLNQMSTKVIQGLLQGVPVPNIAPELTVVRKELGEVKATASNVNNPEMGEKVSQLIKALDRIEDLAQHSLHKEEKSPVREASPIESLGKASRTPLLLAPILNEAVSSPSSNSFTSATTKNVINSDATSFVVTPIIVSLPPSMVVSPRDTPQPPLHCIPSIKVRP